MLYHIPNFFSPDECQGLVKQILSVKEKWYDRKFMYSVGMSIHQAFFDVGFNYKTVWEHYSKVTQENNAFLQNSFPTLYEDFRIKLGEALKIECKYFPGLHLPGFQIICKANDKGVLKWHYDGEKILFPWQELLSDKRPLSELFDDLLTFTFCVNKPFAARYDYYPDTLSKYFEGNGENKNYPCKEHISLFGDICPNPNCPLGKYTSINYEQGTLIVAQGRYLHRIPESTFTSDDEYRMTFQGHGLFRDGVLWLHW